MTLNVEWDPAFVPPGWPGAPGQQQPQAHLDLAVDDLDAAEAWAFASCSTRTGTRSACSPGEARDRTAQNRPARGPRCRPVLG